MTERRYADARAVAEAIEPSYPVYCLAPRVISETARRFLKAFPGRVLYAVKCNPHPRVLSALWDAGVRHFDTASLPEIAQVSESHPNAQLYFMHPVKSRTVTRTAFDVYGVRDFVIDHPAELEKIIDATDGESVNVYVRIKTPETRAAYNLAAKFGAAPEAAAALLRRVHKEGYRAGVSFHVGSQCLSPSAFGEALAIVGQVVSASGVDLQFLDVGGGFPAAYPQQDSPSLADYFDFITRGVRALGLRNDCVLMCEPGRALVADGCSLLTQVQLRKENEIYINDGIYGSLSELVLAKMHLPVRLIRLDGDASTTLKPFKVYGPTCDSFDVLPHPFLLPDDVREDDWIEIGQVGAYSNAAATRFNGFSAETFVQVDEVLLPGHVLDNVAA
ncbi:MAG: type III PLP-dependent enzyme [Gammaproteobacteria bacterium]|nr:type III PLP-dependent enzyme [Gammaproteobacteria bacterium]